MADTRGPRGARVRVAGGAAERADTSYTYVYTHELERPASSRLHEESHTAQKGLSARAHAAAAQARALPGHTPRPPPEHLGVCVGGLGSRRSAPTQPNATTSPTRTMTTWERGINHMLPTCCAGAADAGMHRGPTHHLPRRFRVVCPYRNPCLIPAFPQADERTPDDPTPDSLASSSPLATLPAAPPENLAEAPAPTAHASGGSARRPGSARTPGRTRTTCRAGSEATPSTWPRAA